MLLFNTSRAGCQDKTDCDGIRTHAQASIEYPDSLTHVYPGSTISHSVTQSNYSIAQKRAERYYPKVSPGSDYVLWMRLASYTVRHHYHPLSIESMMSIFIRHHFPDHPQAHRQRQNHRQDDRELRSQRRLQPWEPL